MLRPPVNLKTMKEKRLWLEMALPLPEEIRRSPAYQSLTDEARIVLMLMIEKERGGPHADA